MIRQMTPEERVARVCELREKARREYLPAYRAMMAANGSPVIDGTAVQGDAADDQPVVGTSAAQPEPSAGRGSELPVNGGGHVDQPRRAAREEILGPVDADQTTGWQMWPGHTLGGERHTITREGVDEIPAAYVRCRAPTPMSGASCTRCGGDPAARAVPRGIYPIIGPELATYSVVQPLDRQLGLSMLGTLHERIGNTLGPDAPGAEIEDRANSAWGRFFGQEIDTRYQAFANGS